MKRPIEVTVSGPTGSGKTTLIAILAQVLRNSDHMVVTPEHIPSGSVALADLREQFNITFIES